MISLVVLGQIPPQQIAFLGQQGACRFTGNTVLIGLTGRCLLEQKTVICGDAQVVAVETVDDLAHQVAKIVDGFTHGVEGVIFGGSTVADCIDLIVIDVDHPVGLDKRPAFVLLHGHQRFRLDRYALHSLRHLTRCSSEPQDRPSIRMVPFSA